MSSLHSLHYDKDEPYEEDELSDDCNGQDEHVYDDDETCDHHGGKKKLNRIGSATEMKAKSKRCLMRLCFSPTMRLTINMDKIATHP
jgi:hypothetical protein